MLAGRVRYEQPARGYRTGIEPVLLAAVCPARAGERVLELGTGAGAALLCLLARVPGVMGVGVEIDPAMVAIARANLAANAASGLSIVRAGATALPDLGLFDHAIANPPWHASGSTPSPVAARQRAKQAVPGLLDAWTDAAARQLQPGGTMSLVLPAGAAAAGYHALESAGVGAPILFPLWPRPGVAARLILMQAIRGARGPARILPGAALHDGPGWSAWADSVLRDGAAIPLS